MKHSRKKCFHIMKNRPCEKERKEEEEEKKGRAGDVDATPPPLSL
jgi:hypothetical protein